MTNVYSSVIPALTGSAFVRNYSDGTTLPVLAIKYTGSDTYSCIRCQNATTTGGDFEIWLYSGVALPSSATDEPVGTIKITYNDKTPSEIVSEIAQNNNWSAKVLFNTTFLKKGELWNYFNDIIHTARTTETGWWTSYTGISSSWNAEKTYDNYFILRANRYIATYDYLAQIEILKPFQVSKYAPWYLRIVPGKFIVDDHEKIKLYEIASYPDYKRFSPFTGKPYVYVRTTPLNFYNNYIQLRHTNVKNVTLVIDNVKVNRFEVYTNQGVLKVPTVINSNSSIIVKYEYKETCFIFEDLNLNPFYNETNNAYMLVYILPHKTYDGTNYVTTAKTLFHVKDFTLEGAYNQIQNKSDAIVLGIIKLNSSNITEIIDLRTAGGGFVDVPNIKELYSEYEHYTDIYDFDGKPFPGPGTFILKHDHNIQAITQALENHKALGTIPVLRKNG